MAKPDYSAKVDYVFEHGLPKGFDAQDFVNLAIASLDQAGLSIAAQQRVIKIIEESLS